MLESPLLRLHNGMFLLHLVISIIDQALLLDFILLLHRVHIPPLLNLLYQALLQRVMLGLALEGFPLKLVCDFEFLSLFSLGDEAGEELIFLDLALREARQLALLVLIHDGFLPRNAPPHPLHVIILIFHEWRHSRVQVFNQLLSCVKVLNNLFFFCLEIIGGRAVLQILVLLHLDRRDAINI